MKNLTLQMAAMIAVVLVALTLAAPANAQVCYLRANIPFAFYAGDQLLPAGAYQLRVDVGARVVDLLPAADSGTHRLQLSGKFLSRSRSGLESGMLRFHRYGMSFFFNGVWRPDELEGHQVLQSRGEIELSKALTPIGLAVIDLSLK